MKLIEWIEEQLGRFANFLSDAKEDIKHFDEHLQAEVEKYNNKQCGKAFIIGCVVGIAVYVLIQGIVRSF